MEKKCRKLEGDCCELNDRIAELVTHVSEQKAQVTNKEKLLLERLKTIYYNFNILKRNTLDHCLLTGVSRSRMQGLYLPCK